MPVELGRALGAPLVGGGRIWAGRRMREGKKRRKGKRKEREMRKERERGRERERERGEGKERKKMGRNGFSSFETRIYSGFGFLEKVSFSIVLKRNFNFKKNCLKN